MPEDLIGSAEVVTILGIDKSTLSRWVASGRVETVGRIGNAFVFSRKHIEDIQSRMAATR